MHPSQKEIKNRKELLELIKSIRIGMLTTVTDDLELHSRPMHTEKIDDDGTLWFFTKLDSTKMKEMESLGNVNLSYADTQDNRYAAISGTAYLSLDREKYQELWRPNYEIYYPGGLGNSQLALIRIKIENGEYWDGPSNLFSEIFHFTKALLKNDPSEMGKNEKVNFS